MVRIEELPDDFDESLVLNKPPTAAPPAAPAADPFAALAASGEVPFPINESRLKNEPNAPSLPPGMAAVRSHTADEIVDMINKTPLFMTDLEKAMEEGEDNVMLDAIRALQYEGTRAEVAQGFRESGNEVTRQKNWKDGKEFYTKAIAVLTGEDKWEKPEDPERERIKEREIAEACYANRALCNLELQNYRSTTLDCAQALKVNPKNIKAYYRSAFALLKVDKIDQAEDACARGLHLDPSNKPLQTISSKIAARKAVLEDLAAKRRAEEERLRKEEIFLKTALQARKIRVRMTDQPPELEDAAMHLSPDPLSATSTLVFPCVLLYPMDAQSDFIKEFSETHTIADHLEYIFPLPWDERQEYTVDSVDCFMETAAGGLIKAGKKMSLLKIISGGKIELVDGMVKINVVPASKAAKWIAEMKAKRVA
ncbi:hypothetical protein AJ80_02400 [Polytolypa hystricis UAMH7299]|uniref:Cns1/TTC4 wheel domain-containing protein n=1 Tax=Polytolypa hystricis (strain UAMH7299) TaxID=1447883 RepID=A0A2B7YRF0_POLH7|nr:hypothetical protein AJ80_02400 [Polytolypa hystricis UAMH7299]